MPVNPPGSDSSDAADPTTVAGGSSTARVKAGKAGRAAGPKRTPRPSADATPAGSASSTPGPAPSALPSGPLRRRTDDTGTSATTVVDRPVVAEPLPVPPSAAPGSPPTESVPAAPSEKAGPRRVARPNRGGRRGRRVKRVVRRIDLWSVLKLSLVVYTCLYVAVLATLAALWGLMYSSGTIEKVTSFLDDVGLENFKFYGDQMFRACAAIGAVGVMAGTVITVLATALVNVISEITGGIRLVVIEEDVQG